MAQTKYSGAVAKLLEIGQVDDLTEVDKWPDYPKEYGLNQADVPELIRLATDDDLYFRITKEEYPEAAMWAALHAMRALGQLKATQAIKPLLKFIEWDDEYSLGTIPLVFGLIGPAVLPAIRRALREIGEEPFTPIIQFTQAIQMIIQKNPETRDEAIGMLFERLQHYGDYYPDFNGVLISTLVDLRAEQALPFIEEAFKADKVDNSIIRWHTVQFKFGLITRDEHDRI